MFKKKDEMTLEIREKMRGGEGSAELMEIFSQNEIQGKCRLFSRVTLNPGASIGTHPHDEEEEIYYILSGKGIVNDNGTRREINAGDALKTGGGEIHSIENPGPEPLIFLAAIILFK